MNTTERLLKNEINELKSDLEKARQQFNDALEIISGSQSIAESSYQRAKMIGEERDSLREECAALRALLLEVHIDAVNNGYNAEDYPLIRRIRDALAKRDAGDAARQKVMEI